MTAIVGSSRSRARALQMLALFSMAAWQCHAQSPALQQFCESQLLAARAGMQHIPQVNMRVSTIWQELVHYSGEAFPVYASQQCTAGQSTPYGIYLDISIASDPSIEVTRFFLAHEWGHMTYGDPLPHLANIGQYQMLTGTTAIEDRADAYAARFMRAGGYDILPVLNFFCAIPPSPAGDTHSTGEDRARNVAQIDGYDGDYPCKSHEDPSDHASARELCRRQYRACVNRVAPVDQCVQNHFNACSSQCQGFACQWTCNPNQFVSGCQMIREDKLDDCRSDRDDCRTDADANQ